MLAEYVLIDRILVQGHTSSKSTIGTLEQSHGDCYFSYKFGHFGFFHGAHPFSSDVKNSEKITFLTP